MEADWEFEVGGDAPVIDACWPGFVDLRRIPGAARESTGGGAIPGTGCGPGDPQRQDLLRLDFKV